MLRLFLFCCILISVTSQSLVNDSSVGLARLSDLTLTSVFPSYFCHLTTTNKLLGYYEGTNRAVYDTKCEGFCLTRIVAPFECRGQVEYVKVTPYPNTYSPYASKLIALTVDCNCRPKRCAVPKFGYTQYYEHGQTVYDDCNRRCRCEYGRLVDCCRQRKSFVNMPADERKRYIDTLKIVSTQLPYKTQYDAMVMMHQTLFSSGIHNTPAFLPWHRYHILALENLLQEVDCRVTVPYWDWNAQSASPLTGAPWLNTNDWLGGDGNSSAGNCVTTGPFQVGQWSLPSGACLTRNFATSPLFATLADVQQLYNTYPNATSAHYNGIRYGLEAGPGMHNTVHCAIGGNMCTTNAAASPEFLLHHCNIDRLWANWQSQSPAHTSTYSGNPSVSMPGTSATANDVLDLNNQLGGVKVCYVRPFRWVWLTDILTTIPQSSLVLVPRTPVSVSRQDWPMMKFFNFTQIRIDEQARNSLPNMLSRVDVLQSDTIAQTTGIGLDLANAVTQLDATGCMDNDNPSDINERCDDNCPPSLPVTDGTQILDTGVVNLNATTSTGGN